MNNSESPRIFGFDVRNGKIIASFDSDLEMKAHPQYAKAKAGDVRAAALLVESLVEASQFEEAGKLLEPDVVYGHFYKFNLSRSC